MASAESWRLKNDSARSNAEIRKGIAAYLKNDQVREAAEAWLTLENYYAFFNGPGYGPRIAYYERALKLFNQAGVVNRAADTRRILGKFYMESADGWKLKNDSARCNAEMRKGIAVYIKNGQLREAAEAWLILENYYAFFHGRGFGPRIAYYEHGLKLFNKAHIDDRAAATLNILGDFYQREGLHSKALSALKKALLLQQTLPALERRRLYASLATVNVKLGNYDKALEYAILNLKATQALGDTTILLSSQFNDVGLTYAYIEKYREALPYFKTALQHARKKNNLNFIVIISGNTATTLTRLKRPTEAYQLMQEVQRIYHPADLNNRMSINRACLTILTSMKRYKDAKKYCDTLLHLEPLLMKSGSDLITVQQALGKYFLAVKDYARAEQYTAKFKKSAVLGKHNQALLTASSLQYQIDSAKGDYENELKNYRHYIKLRDRTFDETKTKQIAKLEIQYQTEKKDQLLKAKEANIAILKRQAQLQAVNIKQRETTQKLTIAGAVLLAMLLGLSYNRYRLKQRVNRQLQQQQAEINEKNRSLTDVITEKDNLLEEKEWLMKEIHHRVKNNLQIVISLLNTQSSFLKDAAARNAIQESQHRMQSISLIHQKLYQSDSLAMVNMPAYISDLVQYLSGSFDISGKVKFEIDIADIELDVTKSVPLGLILNEAITNSIKYAFPEDNEGRITIGLEELGEGNYQLTISDNGIGLAEHTDISKSKTLGMSLMRGLAKQLSGTFSIRNNNGINIIVGFNNLSS